MILKTIKKFFIFFSLTSLSAITAIQPVYADNSDSYVSVNVLNTVYYGTLEENSDKTTTFTTLPDSDKQFTITGKWNESTSSFSDKCIITYDDNSTQDVFYKNAYVHGDITTHFSDGTYQTFKALHSRPYQALETFSSDGQLIDIDWYYKCTLMSDWDKAAQTIDYNDLTATPNNYVDLPFKIAGTVDAIYESPEKYTYLKIKDSDNNVYMFSYISEGVHIYASANIENLSVGDSVEITGTFTQMRDADEKPLHLYEHISGSDISFSQLKEYLEDNDFVTTLQEINAQNHQSTSDTAVTLQKLSEISDPDLEQDFPEFAAISCKKNDSDINPLKLANTYEEICRYPFYYIGSAISTTGTVVYEDFDSAASTATLLICEDDTSDIYAVSYKTNAYSSLLNQTVTCSGTLNNTHRVPFYNNDTRNVGYAIYPYISASSLEPVK